jgi:uncharacterized protein YbjT (DUF2867 family)
MARTITIAGGHGQIALRLARLLVARGDHVRGLIRNPDHAEELRAIGVEPIVFDLENDAVGGLANEIAGSDAVVFAAGAGPGSGEARKETMDRDGAIKLIEAAQARNVARYVMVSSIGADSSAQGGGFAAYLRAKGEADDALEASGLDWTIVRPGALTNDPGTGRVAIGEQLPRGEIPRDDVAAVLAATLEHPETIRRRFVVVGGETPIDEALAALARS